MLSSVVLALLAGSSVVLATPGLSVTFEGDKVVKDVDNFKVVAKISNTGDEKLTLLNDPNSLLTPKWNTKTFAISSAEGVSAESVLEGQSLPRLDDSISLGVLGSLGRPLDLLSK